jgi:hypothetical protein
VARPVLKPVVSSHHKESTMRPAKDPFDSIDAADLAKVGGGASRVTARSGGSSDQLTLMLTQITDSIKALAGQRNQSDPSQMLMMMMMMGGLGGGGGGAVAAPPSAPPAINVSTGVGGGGGGGGFGGGGGGGKGW